MLLGVNIDHVATLRNARGENDPDVIEAAKVAINAGARGITAHLREDRRHIKDNDVYALKNDLKCRLNLEMAATDEMQKIALDLLPHACCIVPEKRQEVTTEGGLDVVNNVIRLKQFVKPLIDAGIEVSMFINPDKEQIQASFDIGAKFVELHTGAYSLAFGTNNEENEFLKLKEAAAFAQTLGLTVNAGHGLNYKNVHRMHEIPDLHELNIGHSIICEAIFIGLNNAVDKMIKMINKN